MVGGAVVGTITPTPDIVASLVAESVSTLFPVSITPSPVASATSSPSPVPTETITPISSPTITPVPIRRVVNVDAVFAYSYYYPPLLGPNCSVENTLPDGSCRDSTSSGQTWSDKIGRAVAIPIEYSLIYYPNSNVPYCEVMRLPCIPFGSNVYVSAPPEIVGNYTVIDTCGACIKNGLVYIDFLDSIQRLNWSVPVYATITFNP